MHFQKHCWAATDQPGAGSVLIVEDDKRLMQCLARAMEARGFKVIVARSVCDGLAQIQLSAPEYAVVDMRTLGPGLCPIRALARKHQCGTIECQTAPGSIWSGPMWENWSVRPSRSACC